MWRGVRSHEEECGTPELVMAGADPPRPYKAGRRVQSLAGGMEGSPGDTVIGGSWDCRGTEAAHFDLLPRLPIVQTPWEPEGPKAQLV